MVGNQQRFELAALSCAQRAVKRHSLQDSTLWRIAGLTNQLKTFVPLKSLATLLLLGLFSLPLNVAAAETNKLVWDAVKDRVDADVRGLELTPLLERVAAETGWQVFVEPGTKLSASTKFQGLPAGAALRLLLGDLNFALVPETNSHPHLYVFRSGVSSATQAVRAAPREDKRQPRRVPNELILRVKPGTDIDQLARSLGAKVTGRLPGANLYRLEFPDSAAADNAKDQLSRSSDVASVDYNYYFDQPQPSRGLLAGSVPPVSLQLKPPPDSGRVIVGLIDTGVQPLGGDLDQFLLKAISVAGESALDPTLPSHGTSMAETILRSLGQVTKNTSVQILPVDVYGPNEGTTTWNVANGIVQAVNGGANVINLSLGGAGDSAALRDLVKAVSDRGIPIYAAAGNEPVTTPFYPAAYPGVTAVTAAEQGKIAGYANYGPFVSVAAPDSNVIYYQGKPWFVRGTSASAAYVSGLAAGMADSTHQPWSQIQATILRSFPVPGAGK